MASYYSRDLTDNARRLLLESRYTLDVLMQIGVLDRPDNIPFGAITNTSEMLVITEEAALLGAIKWAAQETLVHREKYVGLVRDLRKELDQTDTKRKGLHQIREKAKANYIYVKKQANYSLMTVDPDDPKAMETLEENERILKRVFPALSTFQQQSTDRMIEIFQNVTRDMKDHPMLAALGLEGRLERECEALIGARTELAREEGEDSQTYRSLKSEEEYFERLFKTLTKLIQAALYAEDRKEDAKIYILRDDPSYRARLRTQKTIQEEPGIDEVDKELGV